MSPHDGSTPPRWAQFPSPAKRPRTFRVAVAIWLGANEPRVAANNATEISSCVAAGGASLRAESGHAVSTAALHIVVTGEIGRDARAEVVAVAGTALVIRAAREVRRDAVADPPGVAGIAALTRARTACSAKKANAVAARADPAAALVCGRADLTGVVTRLAGSANAYPADGAAHGVAADLIVGTAPGATRPVATVAREAAIYSVATGDRIGRSIVTDGTAGAAVGV
jgi:hypothetical protein